MQQVEAGRIDLDRTVASYIPAFAANGKEAVTVRQLLTHTSGFPAWLPLWSAYPTPEARIQAVYDAKLVNPPGSTYLYSDLNMITAGKLVELVTGTPLDQVVHDRITGPLGMRDTGYNPPASELDRIAATEYQTAPPRGMVRGSVHDENAWSLNGVAGHAGVFSTADDLAVLAQTIINGGSYGRTRILSEDSVDALLHNENAAFPGNSHGLGFELDQRWYMDGLSGPETAGHTGYTGTSIVIDRRAGRSSSCSPTGCTPAATGAATTRPGARSPATWRSQSRCGRGRAARPGSPAWGTPARRPCRPRCS